MQAIAEFSDTNALSDNGVSGLLLCGDNVRVLDSFGRNLDGTVACVYMDPPYRNGDDYSHYSDTLSHEQWVSSMTATLAKIWPLLSEDGSVWISIDDSEMVQLRLLCDACFGHSSYLATIVWEHRTTRENRAVFSHNHEYILVYAKNPSSFKKKRNKIPAPELAERYKNPDNDPKGPWQSITATAQAGHAVASQYYPIVSPMTGKVNMPPKGRCWVYNKERMDAEIAQGNIWFGSNGNCVPRIKKYLSDADTSVVPSTLWRANEVGTTQSAKKQLIKLLGSDVEEIFDTPKPEALLHRILSISTEPGDLVLDPFLGSGTTAAVAHKMKRRYIGIDNSNPSFCFAEQRMGKVIDGERSGVSNCCNWKGGGRVLTRAAGSLLVRQTELTT